MLLGFTDQDAFDRVVADARPFYRRVSSDLKAEQLAARDVGSGQVAPVGWLAHGSLRFGRLFCEGNKALTPSNSIGGRRCLVPIIDLAGEAKMVAGVWTPSLNGVDPKAFYIVKVDDEAIEIAPINWDNWLNPERDPRPMLRRSERLVVPGH
jgi:hypothetical protein